MLRDDSRPRDAADPHAASGGRDGGTASFDLDLDAWGRLVLTDAEGRRHVGVDPVRAFPLSQPDGWIALVDAEGRELLLIEDPARLRPGVRLRLEAELSRREFLPIVTRVEGISSTLGGSRWRVETDRGPAEFRVEGDDAVRRLGPRRLLITDAQGRRYLVPDLDALDARSRRRLESYA
jgi:hypothetical protein